MLCAPKLIVLAPPAGKVKIRLVCSLGHIHVSGLLKLLLRAFLAASWLGWCPPIYPTMWCRVKHFFFWEKRQAPTYYSQPQNNGFLVSIFENNWTIFSQSISQTKEPSAKDFHWELVKIDLHFENEKKWYTVNFPKKKLYLSKIYNAEHTHTLHKIQKRKKKT